MNLKEIEEKIKELKKEGLIVLGVGNILKGDDGIGSILASELNRFFPTTVFDCGVSPENYISKCLNSKAKNIIIVDATITGNKPGNIDFMHGTSIRKTQIPLTHGPSLQLVIEILASIGKNLYILGVEPKQCELDKPLSEEINRALENLINMFTRILQGD